MDILDCVFSGKINSGGEYSMKWIQIGVVLWVWPGNIHIWEQMSCIGRCGTQNNLALGNTVPYTYALWLFLAKYASRNFKTFSSSLCWITIWASCSVNKWVFLRDKIELLFNWKDRVSEMELGNLAFELLIVVFLSVRGSQHEALKISDIAR